MTAKGGRYSVALILAAVGSPAAAQSVSLDLPAGRLGQQVMALGRSARISVAVPDRTLWNRAVPALRATLTVPAALDVIARRADARVERVGPASWRLVPGTFPKTLPATRRPRPPAYRPAPQNSAEVVVMASKRDLSPSQFAGQLSRVEGRDLELGGAGGSDRLASRLTTIASTYLGAGRNKLFIRGIADSSFTGPTQATVGQYFGDLRLTYNAPDPDLRLVDLAAVEVLAGPQGTLYGAGSLGGLIRLVPNAPDLGRVAGSVTTGGAATQHGDPGADVQGVLNLPLVPDRIGLRVIATAATEGGYIDKPLLGRTDVNRTRIVGGRATLHLRFSDRWNAELIGIGQRIRGDDSQYADRGAPPLTRFAPVDEGFAADFGQGQFVVDGAIGRVRLRSSTGITAHDLMERYDATAPTGPVRLFAQANRTRMTANETRLWQTSRDGSGWLAGLSYTRNRTRLTRLYGAPGQLRPSTGVSNGVSETTLYGEVSRRLLPGLLATGGARLTRSVLDGRSEDVPVPVTLLAALTTARRVETAVLPSASAIIDLTPRSALVLRYQQGFRPGGLAIENDFVRRFDRDRVATIEAGVRYGRRGRDVVDFSFTVARTAWHDIQADFLDSAGLPSTANIGDGRLWTVETDLGVRVAPGLRLEGAASFNRSRVDEPSLALLRTLSSGPVLDVGVARAELLARLSQIPNIAKLTARAGLVYDRRLSETAELRVDGWFRYVGSSRLGIGPQLGQEQGDYVDSGLTARLMLSRYDVTLGVTNLANVEGNRFALGTPFVTRRDQVTPLRPRTIRLGLGFRF